MILADVMRGVGDAHLAYPVDPGLAFTGVSTDSRNLKPGNLFIALRAERDGHEFVLDAIKQGAVGVLVERKLDVSVLTELGSAIAQVVVPDSLAALHNLAAYWLQQHDIAVIGVTGSVGKTTTKDVIATVLERKFGVLKSERNFNNEIGLPLTLLRLGSKHQMAVLEMGMYGVGEIAQLCRIAPPRIGVVTNVGPSHLERLGTIERIAEAKSELVAALPAYGCAILNGDDPFVAAMAAMSRAPVVLYGLDSRCNLRAIDLQTHGLSGIRFTIVSQDGVAVTVRTPMPGRHSVYACLAAAAVARAEGLSWPEVQAGLLAGGAAARFATVSGLNGSTILDDTYNASPASTIAALDLLAELPGRRIAVLGDMFELGSYEQPGHYLVGQHAARVVNRLICVGERAGWIADGARDAGLQDVTHCLDKDAVDLTPEPGDFVLVKGSRGMRMEQIVGRLRGPEARQ